MIQNEYSFPYFVQTSSAYFLVPNTELTCPHEDPKGLTVLQNFISPEEERFFTQLFDWTCEKDINSLKNRQVKHYGYEFRYGSNDVDLDSPLSEKIPEQCDVLWRKLDACGYALGVPNQLTVNKYSPGQGNYCQLHFKLLQFHCKRKVS